MSSFGQKWSNLDRNFCQMSLWSKFDDLVSDLECRLVSGPQEPTNFPSSASRADGLAWGVVFVVEILGEGSIPRYSSSPLCWSVLRPEACYLQDPPVDVSPGTDAIAASRAILLKEAAAWRCCRPRRRNGRRTGPERGFSGCSHKEGLMHLVHPAEIRSTQQSTLNL